MFKRKTSPALTPVREHGHIQLKPALAAMQGSMPVLLFLIFTKEQRDSLIFYLFLLFLKEFNLDTVWGQACLNARRHWPRASAHWGGNMWMLDITGTLPYLLPLDCEQGWNLHRPNSRVYHKVHTLHLRSKWTCFCNLHSGTRTLLHTQ